MKSLLNKLLFIIALFYNCIVYAQGNFNPFNPYGSGQYGSALQPPPPPNNVYQPQQFQQVNPFQTKTQPPPQNYNIPTNTQSKQQQSFNEVQQMLREQKVQELKNEQIQQYDKQEQDKLIAQTKPYRDALQSLKNMLSGKQKLSIANAYFLVENTYGSNYITSKEYTEYFNKSVAFIKAWMKQKGYSLKNREQVNFALQKFMSEKLTTTIQTGTIETGFSFKTVTHEPYFYDYNDFDAIKDNRSSFVTKIMATGGGQCASMPIVYIALAQMLGIKAYLSYAPDHSFVKYLNNKKGIENYEPTSNWKINDNWYVDNMFVNEEAQKSGIYLDTLNYKQIVADCIMQLADFYGRKFGVGDGKFMQDCISVASKQFPKDNNINLCNLRIQLLKAQLGDILVHYKIKDIGWLCKQNPTVNALYTQIQAIEEYKRKLGYDDTPKGLYEEMMTHQEFGGKRQTFKGIDGTQKRNLFQVLK